MTGSEGEQTATHTADGNGTGASTRTPFVPPARPAGLRGDLLRLYVVLAAGSVIFALLGLSMLNPVPEGKFQMKDGSFINIEDFDVAELGPYPKCHPHFEEHEVRHENGTSSWVKNKAVSDSGPFPVGHPQNPEWQNRSHELAVKENYETRFQWAGLQPNLHLLLLATLCILIGSKHGVYLFTEASATREPAQLLQSEDAYMFPVMGSITLFGLFLVLKYLGTDFVKMAITVAVVSLCSFGVGANLEHLNALVRDKVSKPLLRIPYLDQDVTVIELGGICIGGLMAAAYVYSKNWIVNNIFGISFCLMGIKVIAISNYRTGAIMLVGLFFYDVFWVFGSKSVFGSNVMVSVATGVEAPIKLLFPRKMGGCGMLQHSMLGLGDIVVPGVFVAFLAKFDAVKLGQNAMESYVYLNTTMVAYVLSLVTTVSVMLFFNAAQPALLYIVPFVLITSLSVAISRGELKELWDYVIEDDAPETTGAKSAQDKKDS